MSNVVIRVPFRGSRYLYGCLIATAGFIVLAAISPAKRWWWYLVGLTMLVALWAAAVRQLRLISVRVDGDVVKVCDPYWGVQCIPRGDVTSIEAHEGANEMRGDLWYLHNAHGRALRVRTIWSKDQMEALARAIGVPVCYGGPDCPHRLGAT